MIHYVTVAVALERPPTVQQYRRYALYGGTHAEAELVALQMASCTSVMPVEVLYESPGARWCGGADCGPSPVIPHGALGCRCWPDVPDGGDPDTEVERWLIDGFCPHHGATSTPDETPPPGRAPAPTRTPTTTTTPSPSGETRYWIGPFEWLVIRCQALAYRLVRADPRRPRRRP